MPPLPWGDTWIEHLYAAIAAYHGNTERPDWSLIEHRLWEALAQVCTLKERELYIAETDDADPLQGLDDEVPEEALDTSSLPLDFTMVRRKR